MAGPTYRVANHRVVAMDRVDEVAADMGVSLLVVFDALRLLSGDILGKNRT